MTTFKNRPDQQDDERGEKYLEQIESLPPGTATPVRVHTVFHGVESMAVAEKVMNTGFAQLSKTDEGWFGKGIYFSHDIDYALIPEYAKEDSQSKVKTIIVCQVVAGNPYPVIEHPEKPKNRSLKGKAQVSRHDSHYVHVSATDNYLPVEPAAGQESDCKTYSELVVQEPDQILPLFVLQVRDTFMDAAKH